MNVICKNKNGFMNMAVIIAMSIFVLLFGLSFQYQKVQQARLIGMEINYKYLDSTIDRVFLSLSSRRDCRLNFSGENMSTNAVVSKDSIFINDDAGNAIELLKKGEIYFGLTIQSIELHRLEKVDPSSTNGYRGFFLVTATKGSNTFNRKIPAYVTMESGSSGKIHDCLLTQMATETKTSEDLMCDLKSIGTIYDPSNPNPCITVSAL